MIGSSIPLAALFLLPGIAVLAASVGNGGSRWPWPLGLAVALALGVATSALAAVALGALGVFQVWTERAAIAAVTLAVLAAGRFRLRWPLARASRVASAGFALVAVLASALFLGHPFEMLLGGRDATVYLVSGVGLARGGSLDLHDAAADTIGAAGMRRLYPVGDSAWPRTSGFVKYPGFYYVDAVRGTIIPQGFALLPAVVAIFYSAYGLAGAFAANNVLAVVAALSVFAAGTALFGELGALLGTILLVLDLVEVWAARYPVAEILFQMLLFASIAALLKGGRTGKAIAGYLLGAALFAKVEAALVWAPAALLALGERRRPPRVLDRDFWLPLGATTIAALVYWITFQVGYVEMALHIFRRFERHVVRETAGSPIVWALVALGGAAAWSLRRAGARPLAGVAAARVVGPALSVAVVTLAAAGYWLRPYAAGKWAGQRETLVWLGWYVSPGVLALGVAGLAHFFWTRVSRATLVALALPLGLAAVFLHFMFVNLIHIYLTRRFVPAALPLVCLFAGYLVAVLARLGRPAGRSRTAAAALAALVFAAAAGAIVKRSRHLYTHVEYGGMAASFQALADTLRDRDLVLLSDVQARDLLGPALEFVFGVKTAVVWPRSYVADADLVRGWIERGWHVAALTSSIELEAVRGSEDFERAGVSSIRLHVLGEWRDRFPDAFGEQRLAVLRYAAGPDASPLYGYWRSEGERLARDLCSSGVRLLDGTPFLLRRVRARCPAAESPPRTVGVLAGESDAPAWQATLEAYGARFVRRSFGPAVLFDEIAPRDAPGMRTLSTSGWKAEASDGAGSEALAFDGRLDTRWGSKAPQRPGMTFAISFGAPVDIGWVKVRMGRFTTDRARALAIETSAGGERWKRRDVPLKVDGIEWHDGVPEENSRGDVDLWLGERGVERLRLVNLGAHPRFDWSIAEVEIDGRPAEAGP